MMIRVLTFTFAMLCCLGMQAQEFTLKPVLGGNVSTLTGGKGKGKTEVGVVGGLEGEYRFNPGFSLSAAVLYSQEGCSDDESSNIEIYSPNGHAARLGRMNLVKVPVLANIRLVKALHLQAGLEPAYVTKLERSSTSDGKPSYKHVIVGVPIGLRLALKRTDICLRYTYGLTDVCQDNHSSTFSFLLAFTLGK